MIKYLQVHRPKGRAATLRLREKSDAFAKDVKETYITKGGVIEILGVNASGKSRYIDRIRSSSKELWSFPLVYIKATDSLTDILNRNLGVSIKSTSADDEDAPTDKLELLLQKVAKSVLIIDDLDKINGKKLDIVKDMLRVSRRIVYSAQSQNSLNKTVVNIIFRRRLKKQTITLSSTAAYDASNWLLVSVVIMLAFAGFAEIAILVLIARLAVRGTAGVK